MRLKISESKNAKSFYVIKSYRDKNGKNTSKIVEKLGTLNEVIEKAKGQDPVVWAKEYIDKLNAAEKEDKKDVILRLSASNTLDYNEQKIFNGGYLFLQKIYHELGLNKVCEKISQKYKFDFDLNEVLKTLVYSRVIYPSSKNNTFKDAQKFIEQPKFELQHIYRALSILGKESNFIQEKLYDNSIDVIKRNTNILYYDCTNYFFEIEESDEVTKRKPKALRQYGKSKENRPNPIVQMGLFMDGDGLPLAFDITPGNTNEQKTLIPLEERIINDFKNCKFITCTDAGLSSLSNRKFNSKAERAFVSTYSVKKLKKEDKNWVLDKKNWKVVGQNKLYDLDKLLSDSETIEKYYDTIFYKEEPFQEDSIPNQRLIVTYSIKYHYYLERIRNKQIDRAKRQIEKNDTKEKLNKHDYRRFIEKIRTTKDGEIAEKTYLSLNEKLINEEAHYDGFYAVCTNLDDKIEDIITLNKRRWEIEESFRILKTDFKARPVYLQRDERIEAHFLTCFIALFLQRIIEKRLEEKYTTSQIIKTLRDFEFYDIKGEGYAPAYTRTKLTDDLHYISGFDTSYEVVNISKMKKIIKFTKN